MNGWEIFIITYLIANVVINVIGHRHPPIEKKVRYNPLASLIKEVIIFLILYKAGLFQTLHVF